MVIQFFLPIVKFLSALSAYYSYIKIICRKCNPPVVLGRKNWLFCDTQDGAVASTVVFSLVETAKANGIDPLRYLTYFLENRPNADMSDDELEQLAPWSEAARKQCENNVE